MNTLKEQIDNWQERGVGTSKSGLNRNTKKKPLKGHFIEKGVGSLYQKVIFKKQNEVVTLSTNRSLSLP